VWRASIVSRLLLEAQAAASANDGGEDGAHGEKNPSSSIRVNELR
jgi:hypothetical protein